MVLTIASAALFLAGAAGIAWKYAPSGHEKRVRAATGGISAAAFLGLLAFYAWQMFAADFVYVFDNAQYYYQQLILEANLPYGVRQAADLVKRTIDGRDYTYVMNLFMEPLFSLTDRSIQAFTLCGVVMTWIPLLILLRRLTLRLAGSLGFGPGRTIALHGAVSLIVCVLPLVHIAATRCQINLLGMVFFLEIIALTWGDDFRRIDLPRRVLLFLAVVLLVVSRRWYVFLLAGYLLPWAVWTLVRIRKDRAAAVRFLVYGAACVAAGMALLSEFFAHALQGNYATAYAYWDKGGLPYELGNQARYVGLIWLCVMAGGYLWGIMQRQSASLRGFAGTMLVCSLLTMALFTRIQTMNDHQSIIMTPGYVVGLALAFAGLLSLRRAHLRRSLACLLAAGLLGQYGLCLVSDEPGGTHRLGSGISLVPLVRPDMAQMEQVTAFVDARCTEDSKAFFLTDSAWYDRTAFTNLRMPDLSIRKKVEMGAYSFASQGFPEAWFTAGYVFVPSMRISERETSPIETLRQFILGEGGRYFEEVEVVDFGTFRMHVMRRKTAPSSEEIDALLTLFLNENDQYPALFSGRIERYRPQP